MGIVHGVQLPTLFGYDGKLTDFGTITYGCKSFSVEKICSLFNTMKDFNLTEINRHHQGTITLNKIEQIITYIDENKK